MKKTEKVIINTILFAILIFLWAVILDLWKFLSFIIKTQRSLNGIEFGIIEYVLIFVCAAAIILPIIFRKKLTVLRSLPMTMIISAILAVIINIVILLGAKMYISEYSKEKWDKYPRLRVYMVDDLEREHQIIGMSEEEVKDLLGEPGDVPEWGQHRYEYYAGESIADPYTYDVLFENGVAVETRVWEH